MRVQCCTRHHFRWLETIDTLPKPWNRSIHSFNFPLASLSIIHLVTYFRSTSAYYRKPNFNISSFQVTHTFCEFGWANPNPKTGVNQISPILSYWIRHASPKNMDQMNCRNSQNNRLGYRTLNFFLSIQICERSDCGRLSWKSYLCGHRLYVLMKHRIYRFGTWFIRTEVGAELYASKE